MSLHMRARKLRATAMLPAYATAGAAGLDLHACLEKPMDLEPASVTLVPSGIAVAIPDGYVGLVRDRSGMASRGAHTVAGVIDSDYRGEILVAMHNASSRPITIEHGDRVAQMLVLPCERVDLEEVPELPSSERGSRGFGSTGR